MLRLRSDIWVAALIRRAQMGEEPAFSELLRMHQRRAWRVARNMLPSDEDAEDVTQEAFLRDTLAHCARIPLVRLLLAYAPREAEAWFAGLEPTAELIEQRGGVGKKVVAIRAIDEDVGASVTRVIA